jgi:large subunit ribosomal protein L31
MQHDIHPDYHPVVFVDTGANAEFVTRSTMRSKEKREIDGVEHFVIRLDVSSASHPFFTGKQRFVDAAGRIDKFRSKYGTNYGRRGDKKATEAPASSAGEEAKTEDA